MKPQPYVVPYRDAYGEIDEATFWRYGEDREDWPWPADCPYGCPGDLLWVRETHYRWTGCGEAPSDWTRSPDRETYQSRGYVGIPEHDTLYKHAAAAVIVPSIHMPRWASRILLRITDVRVQRVQEIAPTDALAEGVGATPCARCNETGEERGRSCVDCDGRGWNSETANFRHLWDSINVPRAYSWDANPWVWVVSFERQEAS